MGKGKIIGKVAGEIYDAVKAGAAAVGIDKVVEQVDKVLSEPEEVDQGDKKQNTEPDSNDVPESNIDQNDVNVDLPNNSFDNTNDLTIDEGDSFGFDDGFEINDGFDGFDGNDNFDNFDGV